MTELTRRALLASLGGPGSTGEQHDVASANPAVAARIESIMKTARTESALFPLIKPKAAT